MLNIIILSGIIVALLAYIIVDKVMDHKKELELNKRHEDQVDKLLKKLLSKDLSDYTTNAYYEKHGPSTAVIPKDALSQALTQMSSDMIDEGEEMSII